MSSKRTKRKKRLKRKRANEEACSGRIGKNTNSGPGTEFVTPPADLVERARKMRGR